MESRQFIRVATELREAIQAFSNASLTASETQAQGDALQKRVDAVFSGHFNPTLPSAGKLATEALAAGFTVDSRVQHRLTQAESCW